ncbi:MAG: DUF2931 family protein [Prevotella sp.]|nr:DUF2931 family protein [Prevotella sp.]
MNILVSGNAHLLYPCDFHFALLGDADDNTMALPPVSPMAGEWGEVLSTQMAEEDDAFMPEYIDLVYLSLAEGKFYSLEKQLPTEKMLQWWNGKDLNDKHIDYQNIVVGFAPYGRVALWLRGERKSVLVVWEKAVEIKLDMSDFRPDNPGLTLDQYCDYYFREGTPAGVHLQQFGLPPRDLFDKYMQQFNYRYVPRFMHWDDGQEDWMPYEEGELEPEFDYIEEALFDGTHDKLHDGGLMKYHSAGKPKKLAVKWHVKKAQYTAYFWMDEDIIADIFERFYGVHTDTQADLELHIDYERSIFEFSLFREGMRHPMYISADTYQLIVFKDGFERFRSENYNQPSGAWVW